MQRRRDMLRVTTQHTTQETIEIMSDSDQESVLVVDRESGRVVGRLNRETLVRQCIRGWHEPRRCRVGSHLEQRVVRVTQNGVEQVSE